MTTFKLAESVKILNLSNGLYKICFIGGFSITNLNSMTVSLKNDCTDVQISEIKFKIRNYINGKKAVECYKFEIQTSGKYVIEFKDFENVIMKKSMLFLKELIFPSKITLEKIEIAIEKVL